MERLFKNLYDSELVYEEAFREWAEPGHASSPDKVNAIAQVSDYLKWLDKASQVIFQSSPPEGSPFFCHLF